MRGKLWTDPKLWELPFESIEFIDEIDQHPALRTALFMLDDKLNYPRSQKSYEVTPLTGLPEIRSTYDMSFEVNEFRKSLRHGTEAQLSINWFQRLSWALRRYWNFSDHIEREIYLQREIRDFHKCSQSIGMELMYFMISECSTAAQLNHFYELTYESNPIAYQFHCPLFSKDRLYVKDSIVFYLIYGGAIMTRNREAKSRVKISMTSAFKLYRNCVKGADHFARHIHKHRSDIKEVDLWPGYCGTVQWGPICVYYEPLLVPLDVQLKVRPANLLESWTEFNRVANIVSWKDYVPDHQTQEVSVLEVVRGGIDGVCARHGPFGLWLRKLMRLLNYQQLPLAVSDVTALLVNDHTELWSTDCTLYWHVAEGERGMIFFRNFCEMLPPLAFSPAIQALPETIGGTNVVTIQKKRLLDFKEELNVNSENVIDLPDSILRRIPLDAMDIKGSMPPSYPTFSTWRSLGEAGIDGSVLLKSLSEGVANFFFGEVLCGIGFRKWIKSFGIKVRDFCHWVILNPNRSFHSHVRVLAERELVAKGIKHYIMRALIARRAEKLSQQKPPDINFNSIGQIVDESGNAYSPFPTDLREPILAHFLTNVLSIVDDLDRWTNNLSVNLTSRSEAWWSSNITPDYTRFTINTLASPIGVMPSQPEINENVKIVAKLTQSNSVGVILAFRSGLLLEDHLSELPSIAQFFLRQNEEWSKQIISACRYCLQEKAGDDFRTRLMHNIVPRLHAAAGVKGFTAVDSCMRARYVWAHNHWSALRTDEFKSQFHNSYSQGNISSRGWSAANYCTRNPMICHGTMGRILAELRLRPWPCFPKCVPTAYDKSANGCSKWVEYYAACERGLLSAIFATQSEIQTINTWSSILLEIGYLAYAHKSLGLAYHCAVRLSHSATLSFHETMLSKFLVFDICCDDYVPIDQCLTIYKLIMSMIHFDSFFDHEVDDYSESTHSNLRENIVDGTHTMAPIVKMCMAFRGLNHLAQPDMQKRESQLRRWCKIVGNLTNESITVLQNCHSQKQILPPFLLAALRLKIKHAKAFFLNWPKAGSKNNVIRAFVEYLTYARHSPWISDTALGHDVLCFCRLRAADEHILSDYTNINTATSFNLGDLILALNPINSNRLNCDPEQTIAECAWNAGRMLEKSAGPLDVSTIGCLTLCGKDMVQKSIYSLGLSQRRRSSNVMELSVDYLFSSGYYPQTDEAFRSLQIRISSDWYNKERLKLVDKAISLCFTPSYYRCLLLLKHIRKFQPASLLTTIPDIHAIMDGMRLDQSSAHIFTKAPVLSISPQCNENTILKLLRDIVWHTLCANALCLDEHVEMALISRWQSQGTLSTKQGVSLVVNSQSSTKGVKIPFKGTQSFVQEEYQSLRDYLCLPLSRERKEEIIDECLLWCDLSNTPSIDNYVLDHKHTPTEWFRNQLAIGGVCHGGEIKSSSMMSTLFDLIRGSHPTNEMRAKWLVHYLSSVIGLNHVANGGNENHSAGITKLPNAYNFWENEHKTTSQKSPKAILSEDPLYPVFPKPPPTHDVQR